MRENKYKPLVIDTSVLIPISYSIGEGFIAVEDLKEFKYQTNIQMCITDSVFQEVKSFCSKNPDPLTLGQNQFLTDTASSDTSSQSVRTCWLTKDGTITTYDDKDGLEFKVFNTGVQTLHTTILQSPNYRFKLSIPDMSNISLTDELRNSGDNAAILANDLNLRQRAECH